MQNLDKKIISLLIDLKDTYSIQSLKAEFEAEGATFDEVLLLKKYAEFVGLGLTLKIGGCEAIRDIIDAKKIGVSSIVAPMVESSYALTKFVTAVKSVYSEINMPKLFINIETITAVNNFDEIIAADCFKYIDGVVVGRTDLLGSMELSSSDSDINLIFDIANDIAKKIQNLGKKIVIGGNIASNSVEFLKDLYYLSSFETRKVVFCGSLLKEPNLGEAISKAIEFEILWLENKVSISEESSDIDIKRLKLLKGRYLKYLENV